MEVTITPVRIRVEIARDVPTRRAYGILAEAMNDMPRKAEFAHLAIGLPIITRTDDGSGEVVAYLIEAEGT